MQPSHEWGTLLQWRICQRQKKYPSGRAQEKVVLFRLKLEEDAAEWQNFLAGEETNSFWYTFWLHRAECVLGATLASAATGFRTEPFLLVALGYVYYTFTFSLILPLACWPPASAAAEKLGKFAVICLGILVESEFHLLQWKGIGLRRLSFLLSWNAHPHLEVRWSSTLKYSGLNIQGNWKSVLKTVQKMHWTHAPD